MSVKFGLLRKDVSDMKRLMAILLSLIMLSSITFATDSVKKQDESFSYDNIREYLLKSNPQLASITINIESIQSTIHDINNNLSIINSMDALDAQIYAINQAEMDAANAGTPLSPEQIAANRAKIASIEQQKSILMSTNTQMNASKETLSENLESLRFTKKSSIELVVYTGQNLISSYYKLQNQKDLIKQNIEDFNRQKSLTETLQRVGRATSNDVKNIGYSIDSLKNTQRTLERQESSLISQFNLLLGRDFQGKASFGPFEMQLAKNIDGKTLTLDDYEKEFEVAYNKNIDLQAQQNTYKSKEQYTGEYREAERKLAELRRQFKSNFYDAFHDIFAKQDELTQVQNTLDQKKATLKIAELKYSVGYLSKNDLETAKSAVITQEINAKNAQVDYQNAVLKYVCFINGGWPK